jgi:2-iminobutanoate/2-iminopropanoate deaminase
MKKIIDIRGAAPLKIPIARAVAFEKILFISAVPPTDLKSGKLVSGTIEEETERVLKNMEIILKESSVVSQKYVDKVS